MMSLNIDKIIITVAFFAGYQEKSVRRAKNGVSFQKLSTEKRLSNKNVNLMGEKSQLFM